MKKIVLTGGGTGGHVTPNLALLKELNQEDYEVYYIGSKNGIEKEIVQKYDIAYYGVSTGKLRRYLDIKNFTDAFKIVKGIFESLILMVKLKPNVIFSKGGFVSVPVVVAGRFFSVPVIIHESDITPGLANKICMPFCKVICVNFPQALEMVNKKKAIVTGTPIREELFQGSIEEGLNYTKLKNDKPIILIMGGSQGAKKINQCLRDSLPEILKTYNVVHICGKGNMEKEFENKQGYTQFEYVSNEMPHILKIADIVVSRAGANSIYEFLALKKPNILIPLSKSVSRGDQVLNAKSFCEQGFSKVIEEEDLTKEALLSSINEVYNLKEQYILNMENSNFKNGVKNIVKVIKENTK